jgi:hypothetical protein
MKEPIPFVQLNAYRASHPSANAAAVRPHEIRNAVTISLNHSL